MPDPNEQDEDDPNDTGGVTPDEGQTAQPTNGVASAAPEEPKGGQGEGVQQVKHSDFKRIKEEQRAKGRREAIEELDAKARAAGFESHDDALKALAALKKSPPIAQPAARPTQPQGAPPMSNTPSKKNDTQAADRARAEALRAEDARKEDRKKWRQENRQRRELEAQLAAKDAEMALREECYRAGVKDVDYVIRLLTRTLEGKSQEEIATFDRSKFYEETRKDKPYLFGETVVAATTGTGGEVKTEGTNGQAPAGAPATPNPGANAVDAADKKQFDARKATPAEVADRLRQLGLNPHL